MEKMMNVGLGFEMLEVYNWNWIFLSFDINLMQHENELRFDSGKLRFDGRKLGTTKGLGVRYPGELMPTLYESTRKDLHEIKSTCYGFSKIFNIIS